MRQTAEVCCTDPDAHATQSLEVQHGIGAQFVTDDLETGVMGGANAGNQGVGKSVAWVAVRGAQVADNSTRSLRFVHSGVAQGQVRRRQIHGVFADRR